LGAFLLAWHAKTGLWNAFAFQYSNSSALPAVKPPVFPFQSLAQARKKQPQVVY
jgi:hypothetical protein